MTTNRGCKRESLLAVHLVALLALSTPAAEVSDQLLAPDGEPADQGKPVQVFMVLILKACIGNRSLGWDLLPPGSERFTFEGRTYAGYKYPPSWWVEGEPRLLSDPVPGRHAGELERPGGQPVRLVIRLK